MDNGQGHQNGLPLAVFNALRHLRQQITHFRLNMGWPALKRQQLERRVKVLEGAVARELQEAPQEVLEALTEARRVLADSEESDLCARSAETE